MAEQLGVKVVFHTWGNGCSSYNTQFGHLIDFADALGAQKLVVHKNPNDPFAQTVLDAVNFVRIAISKRMVVAIENRGEDSVNFLKFMNEVSIPFTLQEKTKYIAVTLDTAMVLKMKCDERKSDIPIEDDINEIKRYTKLF